MYILYPPDEAVFPLTPDAMCQKISGIGRLLPHIAAPQKWCDGPLKPLPPFNQKNAIVHQSMNPPNINLFCYKNPFTHLFTLFAQFPLTIQKSRCNLYNQQIHSQNSAIATQMF